MMKGYIVLVDDDKDEMENFRDAFGQIGFDKVLCLESPFEMMKQLQAQSNDSLPALIISDYHMPKLNGFNLVSYIKHHADYKSIKMTILSETILETDKSVLLNAGVSKIYSKPNSFEGYKKIAFEMVELAKQ